MEKLICLKCSLSLFIKTFRQKKGTWFFFIARRLVTKGSQKIRLCREKLLAIKREKGRTTNMWWPKTQPLDLLSGNSEWESSHIFWEAVLFLRILNEEHKQERASERERSGSNC